jgi:hypothetical protein
MREVFVICKLTSKFVSMVGPLKDDTILSRGKTVAKSVEKGLVKDATPLPKGEISSRQPRAVSAGQEADPRATAAEVTSFARARARKAEPKSEIVEQIGKRLRNVYNEVLFQPVPDRFHDLIRALEASPASAADAHSGATDGMRQKDPT